MLEVELALEGAVAGNWKIGQKLLPDHLKLAVLSAVASVAVGPDFAVGSVDSKDGICPVLALLSLAGLAGRFAQRNTDFHEPGYQVRPMADRCEYHGG